MSTIRGGVRAGGPNGEGGAGQCGFLGSLYLYNYFIGVSMGISLVFDEYQMALALGRHLSLQH